VVCSRTICPFLTSHNHILNKATFPCLFSFPIASYRISKPLNCELFTLSPVINRISQLGAVIKVDLWKTDVFKERYNSLTQASVMQKRNIREPQLLLVYYIYAYFGYLAHPTLKFNSKAWGKRTSASFIRLCFLCDSYLKNVFLRASKDFFGKSLCLFLSLWSKFRSTFCTSWAFLYVNLKSGFQDWGAFAYLQGYI